MANEHLKLDLIDPDKLVKVNELKEITNPIFFERNFSPTPDGLLSNEIFGIDKYNRANTFAYIDLYEYFLNPLIYKIWCKIDRNIKDCIHGTDTFSINDKGEIIQDPNGDCGVKFLKNNISKIKLRRTSSRERDMRITFIEKYMGKPEMFISKMIVCPAFYRDVNSEKGKTSVGAINELYRNLITNVAALRESSDYGLNLSDATRGRIQEVLLQIYDYFGPGAKLNENSDEKTPALIPGKTGILHRTVLGKTADYASRLVLSAPELKVESLDDINADIDYSVLPLASACANFLPFIIYNIRRTFENEFSGDSVLPYMKDGKIIYLHPKDYQTEFSDERIKKEIDKFVSGYSDRITSVEVPTEEGITCRLVFKGYNMTPEEFAKTKEGKLPIMDRDLTWLDVIYQAAVESVKDKHILINRYPIDTYFNIFATKVKISSTVDTEPMIINDVFYKNYPRIRQEDIGSNTSNKFIDTLNISNLYLDGIGGDYDGDQMTVRGVFSEEANQELENQLNSRAHYFNLGGKGIRTSDKEAMQSLYNLTLCLPADKNKMVDPIF